MRCRGAVSSLLPNYGAAFYSRSFTHFYCGHFSEVARDYERSLSSYLANIFGVMSHIL
jgi:hypothetical protein